MTTRRHVVTNYTNSIVIEVNNTSGLPISENLPAAPTFGQIVTVKDYGGNCGTYNITILGTIDGSTNFVMTVNSMSITMYWNNQQWNII